MYVYIDRECERMRVRVRVRLKNESTYSDVYFTYPNVYSLF